MIPPSLAASCDDQVSDPLTILTAVSMAPDVTTAERGLGDVIGSSGVLHQSTQVALGTSESGWT